MNRRDFLLFRTDGRTKTVELSCERLYMQFRDAQRPPAESGGEEGGEPPADFDTRPAGHLFADLERALAGSDVLQLTETTWLADEDFARLVHALADRLRAGGIRVTFE